MISIDIKNILIKIIIIVIFITSIIVLSVYNTSTYLDDAYNNKYDYIVEVDNIDNINKLKELSYVKDYYYTESFDNIIGYSSISSMREFYDGKYRIISGRVSTDFNSNSCIIGNSYSKNNNIKVGDSISINGISLKVSGIYEGGDKIITNTNTVDKISKKSNRKNFFILKDASYLNKFKKEVDSVRVVDWRSNNLNIESISRLVLIINIVSSIIIVFIISFIYIRQSNIINTIICSLIGVVFGVIIAVPINNYLLRDEVLSSKNESIRVVERFGVKCNSSLNTNKFSKLNGVANINYISIGSVIDYRYLFIIIVLYYTSIYIGSVVGRRFDYFL